VLSRPAYRQQHELFTRRLNLRRLEGRGSATRREVAVLHGGDGGSGVLVLLMYVARTGGEGCAGCSGCV
jgi:hypothetical protein